MINSNLRKLLLPKISKDIIKQRFQINVLIDFIFESWRTAVLFGIFGFLISAVYLVIKEDKYIGEIYISFNSNTSIRASRDSKSAGENTTSNIDYGDTIGKRYKNGITKNEFIQIIDRIPDYAAEKINIDPSDKQFLSKFLDRDYLGNSMLINGNDPLQKKNTNTDSEEPIKRLKIIDSGVNANEASIKAEKTADFITQYISYWALTNYLRDLNTQADLIQSEYKIKKIRLEHQIAELNQKIIFLTDISKKYSFALTGSTLALDPKDTSSKYYNIGSQLIAANVEKGDLSAMLTNIERENEQTDVYRLFASSCQSVLSNRMLNTNAMNKSCLAIVSSSDVFNKFTSAVTDFPIAKIKQDLNFLKLNYIDNITTSTVPNTYKKISFKISFAGFILGLFIGFLYSYLLCFFQSLHKFD